MKANDKQRTKAPSEDGRMGAVSAGMVPSTGGNNHNLLPVGKGGSVRHTTERHHRPLWGGVCRMTGIGNVTKGFGTYRHTQRRQRQHRSIPGNRAGNAEDTGGAAETQC